MYKKCYPSSIIAQKLNVSRDVVTRYVKESEAELIRNKTCRQQDSAEIWCHACNTVVPRSRWKSFQSGGLCCDCYKTRSAKIREKFRNKIRMLQNNKRKKALKRIGKIKESSPCLDCGQYFNYYQMDFDHRENEVKFMEVSKMFNYKWERIEAEISKCDLVCANCHRKRTFLRNNLQCED